ncbi:hypothetical protein HDU93_000405 [Gonapodya sp. JEL0774]|nr:hypothetical protein HDU93_000405 [Gonapodya sp. JEL0774]
MLTAVTERGSPQNPVEVDKDQAEPDKQVTSLIGSSPKHASLKKVRAAKSGKPLQEALAVASPEFDRLPSEVLVRESEASGFTDAGLDKMVSLPLRSASTPDDMVTFDMQMRYEILDSHPTWRKVGEKALVKPPKPRAIKYK